MARQPQDGRVNAPRPKIFISYSRRDLAFAERLDTALEQRGFEPMIDRSEIYAFEDWWKRIEAMIASADTIVFMISSHSVASEVALKEVEHAASLNKRLAPIVCAPVAAELVPGPLSLLNFIFFDDPGRFDAAFDQLAEALQTDIGWVRQHTDYGIAARRWSEGNRAAGLLLRSPALEEAERWIAARPHNAPTPTEETQAFVAESRRSATRRRNALTGSLAAGLVFAVALAALALWQRGIAQEQEGIAKAQTIVAEQRRSEAEEQRGVARQQRRIAEDQRQKVIEREMNRRAALAQDLASSGRVEVATAVALDAIGSGKEEQPPSPQLRAAIHRTLGLMKVPVEQYLVENVFNLALSPDGRTLAAGNIKGQVYLLDATSLARKGMLDTGKDVVSGLDFSTDGKRLLTSGDKVPTVWNAETGEKAFDLVRSNTKGIAYYARYSPDGAMIAVGTSENRVILYDGPTGRLLHELAGDTYDAMRKRWKKGNEGRFGIADPIVDAVNRAQFQIWGAATHAIFSPDSKLVAVTGPSNPDASVRLFEAGTGKLLRTLTGGRGAGMLPPFSYGSTFAFSPDGSTLAAAPVGVTIKVWDVADGQLKAEFPSRGIESFSLTTDGAAMVSAHANGSLLFRCLSTNTAVVSLQAHDGAIQSLSIDREGRLLVTGATDRTARIWRMPESGDICGFDKPGGGFDRLSRLKPGAILSGHGARITKAVFSPDKGQVFTASQDGWVRAWSFTGDVQPPNGEAADWMTRRRDQDDIVAGGDGRSIFYMNGQGRWQGWDVQGRRVIEVPASAKAIAGGAPGGPLLFDGPAETYRLGEKPPRRDEEPFAGDAWSGPVSPDGAFVIATEAQLRGRAEGEGPLVLADRAKRALVKRLVAGNREAKAPVFSADGSRIFGRTEKRSDAPAEEDGDGLAVWSGRTGDLIASVDAIKGFDSSTTISISRKGSRVLMGRQTNDAHLLDIDGKEISEIALPDVGASFSSGRSMTASMLSPSGRFLLAGRSDGAVVLAEIEQDKIWRVFDTSEVAIDVIAISDDERLVAARDRSNTVWIFDVESGELVHSTTELAEVTTLLFLPGGRHLLLRHESGLKVLDIEPSFAGSSETKTIVAAARKLGFNLVSQEDRQRYRLGTTTAAAETSPQRKWAAINPNSEGTAPVVWGETEESAHEKSIAACKAVSKTCSSQPASTDDLESTFVFYCCSKPRVGCAVTAGSGRAPLRSVKEILAKAEFTSCEVKAALSARDGSAR